MDDFSRLEKKLAKLRQRERSPGEARVLRGAPDALLTAILTEFDETILPRRLSFSSTEGKLALHFAVANRRLQALVAPTPEIEGAQALAGVALKSVEDAEVAALLSVVEQALSGVSELTVAGARMKDVSFPSDVGVPVDQLAKAWNVTAAADIDGEPVAGLAGFVDGLGDRATGWLRIEGEEVAAQGGAEATVEALSNSAAVFLDAYLGKRDEISQGEEGPVGLVFETAGGGTVVFIDAGEAKAFIRAEAADAYDIARDWQFAQSF